MTHATPKHPRWRVHGPTWAVLGLFVVLTLALSWPVVARLSSRLPDTVTWAFDESTFAWNLWYFQHALLDLRASPLHSELIWYPLGIDLILYTYNFFNALIALPLLVAFNLPLASNVTLLLATLLSGFGTYLLAYYVLRIAYSVSGLAGERRNLQFAICNLPASPRFSLVSSMPSPPTGPSMPRSVTTTW